MEIYVDKRGLMGYTVIKQKQTVSPLTTYGYGKWLMSTNIEK